MKRVGIFLLAVLALVAMTAADVAAQPKVTITGLVDNVTSWTSNMSNVDINPARTGDREWYARTRVRPDITAEVGTTKFVLGLEIDAAWGQTSNTDTNVCTAAACSANPGVQQRFGTTHGWDLNTDVQGVIEVKWAYTEFQMPIMPVPTTFRLGAQPWAIGYKAATLAHGDFAGVHVTNQWSPMFKSNFTYAFIEESSTGPRDNFIRGDDFAIVASIELTPFKGLDIRPLFSYANFVGVTSGSSRQPRGGIGTTAAAYQTCPGSGGPGTAACATGGTGSSIEDRFTVGVDARWQLGAFYLDPTVFYQFGSRENFNSLTSFTSSPTVESSLRRDAWFFDVRGGWQAGPLLLEGAFIYTTGNDANDRIDLGRGRLQYYEPISTDSGFYGGWAEINALNIDYFNALRNSATGVNPIVSIGYDKYGLIRFGARASYALTPAFTVRAAANASWTEEAVDTAGSLASTTGITPFCTGFAIDNGTCSDSGKASYLGTEVNLGFQWRFVPNVALDVVASYLMAGNALATHQTTTTSLNVAGDAARSNGRNPQDVQAITARVRYTW